MLAPIYGLTIGEKCTIDHFRVTKVKQGSYCAVDVRYPSRSRWGNLQEILSDVQHALVHGNLPRESGCSWS